MNRFLPILVAATALFCMVATSEAGAVTSLADSHVAHGILTGRASDSASGCSGADDASAPIGVQEQAMLCLTNQARQSRGLAELGESSDLDRSAGFKSGDIIRCDSFSHEACGREFTYWMQKVGYIPAPCWRAGENLAWGVGSYGTVRSIFSAWMHSAGHRDNILGSYAQIGIGLRVGGLDGHGSAHVWTQQFGLRC